MVMKKVFGAGAVMCVAMLSHNAYADGMCGVNLFNPMILTEADFAYDDVYDGRWNEYLNLYLSNYSFGFLPGKSYKVSYQYGCNSDVNSGNQFLGLKLSDGTIVGPGSNVCTGVGNDMTTVEYTSPAGATVVGMVVGTMNGATPWNNFISLNNVMVVDSEQDTSSFIAYEPCIKIATTKMNEVRATAVNERLDDVRDTIDSLITQMQNNAIGVDALAVEKQTRPDATCPAGKNCLLVTDPTNAENWYVIADVNDALLASNNTGSGSSGGDSGTDDSGTGGSGTGDSGTTNNPDTTDYVSDDTSGQGEQP